jgi:hypothetical protein
MITKSKWAVNEKVAIPTRKTTGSDLDYFMSVLDSVECKFETKYDYLLVAHDTGTFTTVVNPGEPKVQLGIFNSADLDPYEEVKTPVVDSGALRYNSGKRRWDLVDFQSLEPMVEVLEYGADKYTVKDSEGNIMVTGANNWKKGLKVLSIFASMLRHTFALMSGEDKDPESGKHHIGHIQCNAMFLAYMFRVRPELDDRMGELNGST